MHMHDVSIIQMTCHVHVHGQGGGCGVQGGQTVQVQWHYSCFRIFSDIILTSNALGDDLGIDMFTFDGYGAPDV